MTADYDKGWGKDAQPLPAAGIPPDRPPTATYEAYPKIYVPPFGYAHPVAEDLVLPGDTQVVSVSLGHYRPTRTTWAAFRRTAVDGRPAAEVAVELGLTPNAVHVARSRVLVRLRAEAAGFLDEL